MFLGCKRIALNVQMKLYNIALKTIVISAKAIVTVFVKSQNNPKNLFESIEESKSEKPVSSTEDWGK